VRDIFNNKVNIKNTPKARSLGKEMLLDWCRDKKLDKIVMNEIMWTRKKYPLPCKDAAWVPYLDEAWAELVEAEGYFAAVVRNIWKDMKKFTEANSWLNGHVNPMNPTIDKSADGKVPGVFFTTLLKYDPTTVVPLQGSATDLKYKCRSIWTISEVVSSVCGVADSSDLEPDDRKLVVVFAYNKIGEPCLVDRNDVLDIAVMAEVPGEDGPDGEPSTESDLPLPIILTGGSRFKDSVTSASNSSMALWYHHTIYYQPSACGGFQRSEMDATPMVTLTMTYPKPDG